jgi:branched-chain amino acid transport system permease protein
MACSASRGSSGCDVRLATGIHHTSYASELRLRHTRGEHVRLALLIVALAALPFVLNNYWLSIVNAIGIAAIGAIGLNILVGFTGQISLGQGGFLAVGAFTSALLAGRAGLPLPLAVAGAVIVTAAAGAMIGLPALRLKGLYLAIATLASQQIIEFVIRRWHWLTDGRGYLEAPPLGVAGWRVQHAAFEQTWYWVIVGAAALGALAARNVFRTALGRSFMAVRDQEVAAQAIGVNVTRAKLTAFALSSGYVGLAGALTAHYTTVVTWERYTLDVSVQYLGMIIVGGLGSIAGSVYGAAFLGLVPPLLSTLADAVRDTAPFLADQLPALQVAAVGVVIIVFLLFEPRGLDRLWRRVKDTFGNWPFRY